MAGNSHLGIVQWFIAAQQGTVKYRHCCKNPNMPKLGSPAVFGIRRHPFSVL